MDGGFFIIGDFKDDSAISGANYQAIPIIKSSLCSNNYVETTNQTYIQETYPQCTPFTSFTEYQQAILKLNSSRVNKIKANFTNTSIQIVPMDNCHCVYIDSDLSYTIDYFNQFNQRITDTCNGPHICLQYQFPIDLPLCNIALTPGQVKCNYCRGRLTTRTMYCVDVYVYR